MTREEMLNKMSSSELTDWMALYSLKNDERREAELKRKQGR